MPGWLKQILNPKILIPVVVVVGAVALLFSFGNPKKILGEMASFNRVDLIWIFLVSLVYEAVRFVQWLYLLHKQGVKAPVRAQVFSFAGGEATRFIPVGNYFQNYLLSTAEGVDFAYTSAATTLIILYEVVVCLGGLIVLGLGDLGWIRPVIVVGLLLAGAVGWLLYKFHGSGEPPAWVARRERQRKLWETSVKELRTFGKGAKRVIHPKAVAVSTGLAAIYLIAGGGILYLSLSGIGWTKTSFFDVLAVYFFSLAFGLIVPLPVDIGVTELSGVGAFLAVGVDRNAAISAMLINRVLTVGFSVIIFLVVAVIMRDETKKAWSARGAHAQQKRDGSKPRDGQGEQGGQEKGDATRGRAGVKDTDGEHTSGKDDGEGEGKEDDAPHDPPHLRFRAGDAGTERGDRSHDETGGELAGDAPRGSATA